MLREIRIHCSGLSLSKVIQAGYPSWRQATSVPIMIREHNRPSSFLVARYDFGREISMSIEEPSDLEVLMKECLKNAESTQ